jgi:TolC family type I secretion outer membrane protein
MGLIVVLGAMTLRSAPVAAEETPTADDGVTITELSGEETGTAGLDFIRRVEVAPQETPPADDGVTITELSGEETGTAGLDFIRRVEVAPQETPPADDGVTSEAIAKLYESRVAGLGDTLNQMLENQPRYLAAKANQAASEEGYQGSWSGWLPTVSMTVNGGNERKQNFDSDDTDLEFHEGDLSLTQLVYDFGSTNAGIANARLSRDNSDLSLAQSRQTLMLQGISTLLNLHRAVKAAEFARDSEAQFKRLVDSQKAKFESGGGVASDVTQAESQYARAQARSAEMDGQVAQMKNNFRELFGIEAGDDLPVPLLRLGDRIPDSEDEAVKRVLKTNIALRLAKASVSNAYNTETIQQAAMLPKFELKADYKYKYNVSGTAGKNEERLVKFEMNWPLFSGRKNVTALRASRYRSEAAQWQLHDTQRNIEQQARGFWLRYTTQVTRVDAIIQQTQLTADFLVLARKELELGARPLLEVLAAEVQHIEALNNTLSAIVDLAIAQYGLLQLEGTLEINNIAL